jgi:hypothetical protein
VPSGDGLRLFGTITAPHYHCCPRILNIHYPHLKGTFARVIDHYEPYAAVLLDNFKIPEKAPHLAVSDTAMSSLSPPQSPHTGRCGAGTSPWS